MSSQKRVLLPQPIESEAVLELEQAGFEVVTAPDPKPETVLPLMSGVHGLVLRTGIKITRELLEPADELCIISRTGGGLDNVDLDAATDKNIVVTSNLGVNTQSVVEQVLAFVLALSKRLFDMDRAVRNENYSIRYKNLPRDIWGMTLGVMGFGRIGATLGRICKDSFNMTVIAYDPVLPDEVKDGYSDLVTFVDKETLFSESDIISVHVPLTEATRNSVSTPEFERMKPEALLINTSRGSVVDEDALVEALKAGKIGGAGLDVLSSEPPPPDHPLLTMDNVILTPHSSALTRECVIRMAVEGARCVIDLFQGRVPANVANRSVLASDRWKGLSPRT